jgi:hypothetical protein
MQEQRQTYQTSKMIHTTITKHKQTHQHETIKVRINITHSLRRIHAALGWIHAACHSRETQQRASVIHIPIIGMKNEGALVCFNAQCWDSILLGPLHNPDG